MIEIAADYQGVLRGQGLDTFERLSRHFFPDGLPRRNRVHVRRMSISGPEGDALEVFYKQYEHRRPSWRFWGRASKARREYRNYAVFQSFKFPCAVPLAFGEERDPLGRLSRAFILTRAVPDSVTLVDFFEHHLPQYSLLEQKTIRAELVRQMARITRVLHQASFYHSDLVWRNVLVTCPSGQVPVLWLIDCPRGKFVRWPLWRRRGQARDLGSLDKLASRSCTRKERIRFLRIYLEKPRLDQEARALIRKVRTYWRKRWPDDWAG